MSSIEGLRKTCPGRYARIKSRMHREVKEIRQKLLNSPWPKYLRSIEIDGLHQWKKQEIRLDFPVVVIAGENGSGKSTVLKAAACAYAHPSDRSSSFYPSTFFPDTTWDRVANATITYKIREGKNERTVTARKISERWRTGNRPRRHVTFEDISRTLPLDATVGYARIARKNALEASADQLNPDLTKFYSSILGRSYDQVRIAKTNLDAARKVGVVNCGPLEFSQFHQGAGEDATLDLLQTLQEVPETALVIIDEVEASLHPRSQRRLVHFLLWLARTKHIQVVLSSHSGHVLEELPRDARIFLQRGHSGIQILYGVSPNYALNRMDDYDRPDLYIFIEDGQSKVLLAELLRQGGIDLGRVKCLDTGPADMVKAIGRIAHNDGLPVKSLAVVDGDTAGGPGCQKLPGSYSPERQVLQDILGNGLSTLAQRLDLSEQSTQNALEQARAENDVHNWIGTAARLLNQTNSYLWETMCKVWVKDHLLDSDATALVQYVHMLLSNEG